MFLYSALLYALVPLIVLRLLYRSIKNPAYRRRIIERFAYYTNTPQAGGFWVHAVSVGESIAAIKLVKALQIQYPGSAMTVTCGTPTGSQIIQQQLGNSVFHVYAPYDLPGSVSRFMNKIRPALGIIMETEIWPNMLHAASRSGVKLMISNMRLSETSYRRYQKFPRLIASSLAQLDFIATQTDLDAQRAISLGAEGQCVRTLGNLKFDIGNDEDASAESRALLKQGIGPQRTIWLAGSTHDGEDELILKAHKALLTSDQSLLLILIPRHPERFDDVFGASCRQFQTRRRSELDDEHKLTEKTQVLLIDSMGELLRFMAISDWAFIGGSLVPVGGHNILEACQVGVPVVFGQYMFNFKHIAEMVVHQEAGIQVDDESQLLSALKQLSTDVDRRRKMGVKGYQLVKANQGALAATLEAIDTLRTVDSAYADSAIKRNL